MSLLRLIRAQVEAEMKTRLRSPSTIVAAVALLALSFYWIPDPASGAVSVGWEGPDGRFTTGIYNSAYVGAAASILASIFLTLIGFYLVAGSVRRDEDTRVGAILAATPISKTAYLAGKLVAHIVYLVTMGAVSIAAGMLVFVRYGVGPFRPGDFLTPFVLLVVPGLAFTASCAVLFDAVPALRRRGGLVLFFFAWIFVFFALPVNLAGGFEHRQKDQPLPIFDPAGVALFAQAIADSVPGGEVKGISMGVIIPAEPPVRVAWQGVRLSGDVVRTRALSIVWVLGVFALAVAFFDRFDSSRRRGRGQASPAAEPAGLTDKASPDTVEGVSAPRSEHLVVTGISVAPGFRRSVGAEVRLLWREAGWLRWPLLAAAVLAAGPLKPPHPGIAALLLLLGPVLSEAAAREKIAGSAGLIFSQPGIPRVAVAWKAAAALAFVALLAAPGLVVTAFQSPARGGAYLAGLCFVAAFATGAASLTGGGKIFLGSYLALWYGALNSGGTLDFSGVLGQGDASIAPFAFLGCGLALLGVAALAERIRGDAR